MKHLNTILKIKKEFRFAVSFISFLLFFISGSYSQVPQLQWEKHDWNRIINNICTTNDGYVIVGKNLTGGGYSFVMKLNQSCDSVWEKGFFHDSQMNGRKANCVIQTSDGNYVFTGKAYYDIFVVKLNQNGDTLWQKFYGTANTDEAYCIEETSDGGLVLTGVWEYGESTYEGDAFVMKLDANGNRQWLHVFEENNNYGTSVKEVPNGGGYIVLGITTEEYIEQAFLALLDTLGNVTWKQIYGKAWQSTAEVVVAPGPEFIFSSFYKQYTTDVKGVYIERVNVDGELIQETTILPPDNTVEYNISTFKEFPYGGYFLGGYKTFFADAKFFTQKAIIIRLGESLDSLWEVKFNSDTSCYNPSCYDVELTEDNGYVMCGRMDTLFGYNYNKGGFIYKTTPDPYASVPQFPEDNNRKGIVFNSLFPNPFGKESKSIQIDFSVSQSEYLEITICDMLGNTIKNLQQGYFLKGKHSIVWNGTNRNGETVTPGIYLAVIKTGKRSYTKKVLFTP